jgi:hypothetical protein
MLETLRTMELTHKIVRPGFESPSKASMQQQHQQQQARGGKEALRSHSADEPQGNPGKSAHHQKEKEKERFLPHIGGAVSAASCSACLHSVHIYIHIMS